MTELSKRAEREAAASPSAHALTYTAADADDAADSRSPVPATTKLVFVTPEMGDFIKAGGLGDVSAALPRQLRAF